LSRPSSAARQPKSTDYTRVHVFISPPSRLKLIERAARQLNLSRSNFIVMAAYEAAQRELAKDKG